MRAQPYRIKLAVHGMLQAANGTPQIAADRSSARS
jgi:hypothetical protein